MFSAWRNGKRIPNVKMNDEQKTCTAHFSSCKKYRAIFFFFASGRFFSPYFSLLIGVIAMTSIATVSFLAPTSTVISFLKLPFFIETSAHVFYKFNVYRKWKKRKNWFNQMKILIFYLWWSYSLTLGIFSIVLFNVRWETATHLVRQNWKLYLL